MHGFSVVTNEVLIDVIKAARRRLVVVAPAVSVAVAEAIAERWRILEAGAVSVVLDGDPEVYRLGYGEPASLEILTAAAEQRGTVLKNQPGLRVAVVVSDDHTLVYAPTAQLIEGSRGGANGLSFGTPPPAVKTGVGLEGADPQVGRAALESETIKSVEQDLKSNPPQKFDVARRVRVFNAFMEFVELQVIGTRLSRHTVRIPTHLLAVADQETRERLRATFMLVPPEDELSGDEIDRQRKLLEAQFVREIPTFGAVILRRDKEAFEKGREQLEAAVAAFGEHVRATVKAAIEKNRQHLKASLLPGLIASPPAAWRANTLLGPDAEAVERLLDRDLRRCFGSAERLIKAMKVRCRYKGVTYEMLSEPKFLGAATNAFPDLERFHEEFDAARATEEEGNLARGA